MQTAGTQTAAAARHSVSAFNAATERFMTDLASLFPRDVVVTTIRDELRKAIGAGAQKSDQKGGAESGIGADVPALLFAKSAATTVALGGADGETSVSELIMNRDERLFDHIKDLDIAMLSKIDLAGKYRDVSDANRQAIWTSLNRLLNLSSAVAIERALAEAGGVSSSTAPPPPEAARGAPRAPGPVDDIVGAVARETRAAAASGHAINPAAIAR